MIKSVLIFNTAGKPRLSKFYSPSSPATRAQILSRIFDLVSNRPESVCNFVELPSGFGFGEDGEKEDSQDEDLRVIYRHYATLYFVFVVDQSESELGILDLIQVFVESLDRCFENVCELDLIFHFDDVHVLLACIITGGLVLETSIDSIATTFANQKKTKANSTASYTTPFSTATNGSGVLGGLGSLGSVGSAISVMKGFADGGIDRLGIGSRRGR